MSISYYTIKQTATDELIIQKSRFIGHIFRINSEQEARDIIERIRKTHWKANHNCYAYVVGDNQAVQKASDDGEPSGTAGIPILEVIKKKALNDCLIVVTRYFGGIKLGAGGLIRAYSKSAAAAIDAAGIVQRVPMSLFKVVVEYPLYGTVENALKLSDHIVSDTVFEARVKIIVAVRSDEADEFVDWMTNLCNGQCEIQLMEETSLEVDVTT
ncbi:YigZ family protein [Camelliibacillus cellulosilyticus]|uniref:YigZ family protein n=1 Tax=Camelliibacillus cellulosilyticus TaxID=2174486 RepID=A0ABV9GKA5_9BACL